MLSECPQCHGLVAETAASCPHCGQSFVSAAASGFALQASRLPVFLVLAVIGLMVALNTPRIALGIAVLATVVLAGLSALRREPGWGFSLLVMGLTITLYLTTDLSAGVAASPDSVKVTQWNWTKTPDSKGEEKILWKVRLQNVSNHYVQNARLALTTYDAAGKVVLMDFAYVSALPPGESRLAEHRSGWTGTEAKATVRVAEVTTGDGS